MPPRRVVLAAVLAVLVAGCDGRERSFRYLSAPFAPTSVGAPPAPNPPSPAPRGPTPPGGPSYTPGVGTTAVASGETVDSIVVEADPACFPDWDASARCKVFEITPEIDGTLTAAVRLSWPPAYENLDLFLIDLGRAYVTADAGRNAKSASIPVTAGSTYGIAVMVYEALPAAFQLSVEVAR